jgi:hypothetical protein
MEDFNVNDRVRIKRINTCSGFTSLINQEGTIEEQDYDDPDGLVHTVHINDGPTLYFANSELEHM